MDNIVKQFAEHCIEDGQLIRPFGNFFFKLYDELKGKEFTFEGMTFNDPIEFSQHLQGVLSTNIQMLEDIKEDSPEEYNT
jgi:hypothetical protein